MKQNSEAAAKYRALCAAGADVPFFSQPYWLDAVAVGWGVVLAERDGQIVAALPYYMRKKWGVSVIAPPPFTQTSGVWLRYPPNQKYHSRLAFETEFLTALIKKMPPFAYFNARFHHTLTNWLPFYWRGFRQTTRYTYRLPDIRDLDRISADADGAVRTLLRKTKGLFTIETDIESKDAPEIAYQLFCQTMERQGLPPPCSLAFFLRIDAALQTVNRRRIFLAKDAEGRAFSMVYIGWDAKTAYLLFSGDDPARRALGGHTTLVFEAIRYAAQSLGLFSFDFEGSMIKSIENTYRDFGAIQTPYFEISKYNHKILKYYHFLKGRL